MQREITYSDCVEHDCVLENVVFVLSAGSSDVILHFEHIEGVFFMIYVT
jgi:hypothetical protein